MQTHLTRWVEIDAAAARSNARLLHPSDAKLMAVVKADCYGHGLETARLFAEGGADWFGVATVEEALALRDAGAALPILVLGYVDPAAAAQLGRAGVTVPLLSSEHAAALSAAAMAAGVTVQAHGKVDTGMGRIGFAAEDAATPERIAAASRLPGLRVDGVFTHFAVSDEATPDADAYTARQYEAFCRVIAGAERLGARFSLRHCCNSAAALRFPQYQLDMVRVGIALYGLPAGDAGTGGAAPVLSWRARVTQVKDVPAGAALSYGRTYRAARPMRVATVAVGYADGYRRQLSNRGALLVRGRRAPVVGRVCMDQILLDVTGIEGVRVGDTATILGRDGAERVPVEEMAAMLDTIPYEITCLIGPRSPRLLVQNTAAGKDGATL